MPAFRLDADYDRQGRVTGRAPEHDARDTPPGAILLANLDVDARPVPSAVRDGDPVPIDAVRTRKSANDDELAEIRVMKTDPAAGCVLRLAIAAPDSARITVWDGPNTKIAPVTASSDVRFPLPGPKPYLLEAVNLAGAPAAVVALGAAPVPPPGPGIRIRLECDGAAGEQDTGLFTIAPLQFMDNSGHTERVYICEVSNSGRSQAHLHENVPAVTDVANALARAGVPLYKIPESVHGGDTWIQDQYQLGYCRSPSGWLYVVLHLPRTRADAASGVKDQNLSTLINSHFPARNLGVYNGFWDRQMEFRDATGQTARLAFTDGDRAQAAMARVFLVRNQLLRYIQMVGKGKDLTNANQAVGGPDVDFFAARTSLPELLQQLEETADRRASEAVWAHNPGLLRRIRQTARSKVTAIVAAMPVQSAPPRVRITLKPTASRPSRDLDLGVDEANKLHRKLGEMLSSQNYGGNIEVGPATPDAPAGKIVVGNVTTKNPDGTSSSLMDPELLAFLRGQSLGGQPIVEIDTSWLEVGHVDEILAFVPTRRSRNGAAILRASPEIAWALIKELDSRFRKGMAGTHDGDLYPSDPWRYSPTLPRLTNRGTAPVTHLLRGKDWLYDDSPDLLIPVVPPWIYLDLAKADASFAVSAHRIPLPDPPGTPDQARKEFGPFPARISILEVQGMADSTNDDLEQDTGQLTKAEQVLTEAFGNVPILRLPVLFDNLNQATNSTSAFTPDLANLQVIGDRLLVPRPFGPRTTVDNAVEVLRAVGQRMRDPDVSRFTAQTLRARGLDRCYHWVNGSMPLGTGLDDAARLADEFADGFPGQKPEDIRKAIIRANPGAFLPNGDLTPGWRKLLIPEDTVDVFEAWTDAVAAGLGLHVEWVDAWYYHLRLGSIHCGTNVIRRPTLDLRSAWWRAGPATASPRIP